MMYIEYYTFSSSIKKSGQIKQCGNKLKQSKLNLKKTNKSN